MRVRVAFKFAAGYGAVITEGAAGQAYGVDLRGTVGTLNSHGLWPHSTYAGIDAGYTFSFVHASLGVAYRMKGDPDRGRWMVAPTLGIVIPFGPRW